MKKRYVFVGLLVLVLAVALSAAACDGTTTTTTAAPGPTETTAASTETTAASTETTAASTEPIKVGHIVDITGREANVGAQFKTAIDYAFTNATVNGRPVQIIEADAKSDTAAAVDAAKKLVEQDKVVAILGPTEIGQKTAVAEYCKSAGVPLLFYNPTPPDALKDNEWLFAMGGTTTQTPSCIADYAFKTLGYKTVVTLTTDDTAGRAWADPFKAAFEALGGKVVQQQWTPFTEDYSPYLTALETADALVAWEGGSAGMALLNQYLELGINKKMPIVAMYNGGFTDPWVINAIAEQNAEGAKALIGICTPMTWNPDSTDQASVDFVKGITPLLPYGPPGDSGYAAPVQAAQGFLTALASIKGELTGDAIRQALLSTKFTGPEGSQFFASGEQAATKTIYIEKVISIEIPNKGTIYKYANVQAYPDVPPAGLGK